ncbi:MAG TPA: hypothetical protein PK109_03825 [Candidatus Paceibacterota bacterium]|nr:hypothetical protein [Candidatus Paceibacterota bacterium]
MYVEYESNNSWGSWWLEDSHWRALEAAGWKVQWAHLEKKYTAKGYERDADGTPLLVPIGNSSLARKGEDGEYRWLGALATCAFRVGLGLCGAADEWKRITGMDITAAGCACCGQPHTFTEYDDAGKFVRRGPFTSYEARW